MKFTVNSIKIACKSIKGNILLLLVILVTAGFVARFTSMFASNFLKDNDFKINMSIVNYDGSDYMNSILNIALSNKMINEDFNVVVYDNMDDAKNADTNAIAIAELPEGILESILIGENISPILHVNRADPLVSMIVENFVTSISSALTNAQSGVYTLLDKGREYGYTEMDFIFDVNMDYINFIINSDSAVLEKPILYSNTLDLMSHYMLSLVIFLVIISTVLFFPQMNILSQKKMAKHIASVKSSYQIFYFSKILVLTVLYWLLLLIACVFMQMTFSVALVFSCLNVALFIVLIQSVIFSLTKNFVAASGINFILQSAFLYLSGGIIPSVLMPKFITNLSLISPHYYIKDVLTIGFVPSFDILISSLVIITLNIVFAVILYVSNDVKIKGGAYIEDF